MGLQHCRRRPHGGPCISPISPLYLPYISDPCGGPLRRPISPYISLHLPTSPYISLHLPISPYISLYLPTSPYISQRGRSASERLLVEAAEQEMALLWQVLFYSIPKPNTNPNPNPSPSPNPNPMLTLSPTLTLTLTLTLTPTLTLTGGRGARRSPCRCRRPAFSGRSVARWDARRRPSARWP